MYQFKFADIGEGIHEGRILEWNYKIGDIAKEGETLVVIETDKVNAEIPVPVDGKITKLGPAVGETVFVGDLLAEIDDGEAHSEPTSEKDNEEAGVVG
nr:2-oxo acid dehydrogenase subunit E2 [Bacillota bacterium]